MRRKFLYIFLYFVLFVGTAFLSHQNGYLKANVEPPPERIYIVLLVPFGILTFGLMIVRIIQWSVKYRKSIVR